MTILREFDYRDKHWRLVAEGKRVRLEFQDGNEWKVYYSGRLFSFS